MNLIERIKFDFLGPIRYDEYGDIIQKALDNGYTCVTVRDFDPNKEKQVILRHDVDVSVKTAKEIYKVEKAHGVHSSFYFRFTSFNKNFINELEENGFEGSYHFEEIATYAYKHNISDPNEVIKHYDEIAEMFYKNIEYFRKNTNGKCITVASHGDFVNRKLHNSNNDFLSKEVRKKASIKCEAYDKVLMDNVNYCSDCQENFKELCDFESAKNYYILVHPSRWGRDFWTSLREDITRAFRGLKYKLFSK